MGTHKALWKNNEKRIFLVKNDIHNDMVKYILTVVDFTSVMKEGTYLHGGKN